jgi:hypothetical protein
MYGGLHLSAIGGAGYADACEYRHHQSREETGIEEELLHEKLLQLVIDNEVTRRFTSGWILWAQISTCK